MKTAVLAGWLAGLGVSSGMDMKEATRVIQEEVRSRQEDFSETSLCDKYTCCEMSDSENCSLDSLPASGSSLVLPGGETRCIFSYSTPFAFQVFRGDSDKLLFYFQGGGACWDKVSTELEFCTTNASPSDSSGVFDKSNDLNDYKDYTIVQVLYCSGDIHGGDTTRPYDDKEGVPVEQKGYANTQATLDWVKAQQANGQLASKLSDLVVMGCSAGSIGAQYWYTQVASALNYDKVAAIPDSYAGVFPPGSQGPLVKEYGFCKSGFLSPELIEKCNNGELTLQDMDMEFMTKYPDIPLSFIQSKTDDVQISFYISVGATTPNTTALITPAEFYADVNSIFELYNTHSNFVSYLVDGSTHCFTPSNRYYTADALGPDDNGAATSKPMMYSWTGNYPLANGETTSTVCEGELQAKRGVAIEDNTYCDANLVPKTYSEEYEK